MNKLEKLRARLGEVREEMRAIAETDADELTDEQEARFSELEAEVETVDEDGAVRGLLADIDREERRADMLERMTSGEGNVVKEEAFSTPNINRNDDPFDLDTLRVSPLADRDEVRAQVVGRAKTAVERVRAGDDERHRMANLLDEVDDAGWLAKRYLTTGSELYERAFANYLAGRPSVGDEARAIASGTDNKGGFAIPVALDPTVILTSDGSINPLRQISRVESITTNKWEGVTHAGVTTGYQNEADQARSGDEGTFSQITVEPQRATAWIPFSFEAEQDWVGMRDEMARLIADSKDDLEADKFITGSGTDEPAGVVKTLASSSAVDTDDTATLKASDVYDLEVELPPRFRQRASVLGNRAIFSTIRQFASSDGHDLWERIGAGLPPQLLGYDAFEASAMDATISAGNELLLMGDFRYFLIVDRVGMSVELVPHVFGANQRPTGQRGLFAYWRNSSVITADNAFRVLVAKSGA